jgi:hypothetical protein
MMSKSHLASFEDGCLPQITLKIDPKSKKIQAGQPVTLNWATQNARRLFLVIRQSSICPTMGAAVYWDELERVGEQLELKGATTLHPESTTTYVFAAMGDKGRYFTSVTIDVVTDETQPTGGHTWYLPDPIDPDVPHFDDFSRDDELFEAIRCSLIGPRVRLTVDPHCLFKDKDAEFEWISSCATYVEFNFNFYAVVLNPDLSQRSGTSIDHFEGGGGWEPFAPRRDERRCSGFLFGLESGCEKVLSVSVRDDRGRSDGAQALVGFIPHPIFMDCDVVRQRNIESALLDIYCCLLQEQCLLQNRDLDHDLAAFRDGHLSRTSVWLDLLTQLENLHLTTFRCRDVADADWRGGWWTEYTNEFELQWSPLHRPNLFYIILHELIHKVGFHGDLLAHYTEVEIENQAQRLTAAVMRCCQEEMPDIKDEMGWAAGLTKGKCGKHG